MGTARSLVLEWVFIRALFLAHYSSSLCYRLYPGSSTQAVCESCCAQTELMISVRIIEELLVKVNPWKTEMEKKGYV